MNAQYTWPLNDNHFSLIDKLQIAYFILNPKNRWTEDRRVRQLENVWADITGYKYVVATNSGTSAIELMARVYREMHGVGTVAVPAVTWPTSVTPWIHAGYTPVFIDIDLKTLCMSETDLKNKLNGQKAKVVFPTSVLGSHCETATLKPYGTLIGVDNCESSFSLVDCHETSVTSLYFGHQFTTGTEGGLLFTNCQEECRLAVHMRGHGMTSSWAKYNNEPCEKFKFAVMGSNYRSNDIAAYMGLMDMRKFEHKQRHRNALYNVFCRNIRKEYQLFNLRGPFALPIITSVVPRASLIRTVEAFGIETRPIISGNILRQPAFQQYDNGSCPNANYIHDHGFYVGLHEGVPTRDIVMLTDVLNEAFS